MLHKRVVQVFTGFGRVNIEIELLKFVVLDLKNWKNFMTKKIKKQTTCIMHVHLRNIYYKDNLRVNN